MSGINTAGVTQPADLLLGRGRLYGAPIQTSGLPGAYRFFGNTNEIKISQNTEKLSHKSSQHGLKVIDKEVIISQEANVTISFEEINWDNLALFFSGTTIAGVSADNAAVAGFVDQIQYGTAAGEKVPPGRWYDLRNGVAGARAYDLNLTNTVIKIGATTLVVTTDYELDNKLGLVFIKNSATVIGTAAGDDLIATITAKATAKLMDEVKALTTTPVPIALKFVSENAADSDRMSEYQIHKIGLKATGDLSLISDDFAACGLEGLMESNVAADSDSPYMTVRSNPAL